MSPELAGEFFTISTSWEAHVGLLGENKWFFFFRKVIGPLMELMRGMPVFDKVFVMVWWGLLVSSPVNNQPSLAEEIHHEIYDNWPPSGGFVFRQVKAI